MGSRQQITQAINHVIAIFVVAEDLSTFNAPDDNMVNKPWGI
jgi:hypothetical protein